jgi:hypothetical protein
MTISLAEVVRNNNYMLAKMLVEQGEAIDDWTVS